MKPFRVKLLGYYGFGNLGDEAVLAGILTALRHEFSSAADALECTILSADPHQSEMLHPGARAASRRSFGEMARALRGTDLFVLGGGSLLQDATSVRSVLWYSLTALLARRLSRRVLWWAQGIGPLQRAIARRLVSRIATQADGITVRDPESANLLKAIVPAESKPKLEIQEVADPAFLLAPVLAHVPEPTLEPAVSPKNPKKPFTVVSLRAWPGSRLENLLPDERQLFPWLSERTQSEIVSLPMHLPSDERFHQRLGAPTDQESLGTAPLRRPDQAINLIGGSQMVVAMRLHAVIFAARCGVPFVALSYDPKVNALAAAAGQEDAVIPVTTLTTHQFSETIQRVLATRAERAANLRDFAAEQQARALQPAKIARRWYDEDSRT